MELFLFCILCLLLLLIANAQVPMPGNDLLKLLQPCNNYAAIKTCFGDMLKINCSTACTNVDFKQCRPFMDPDHVKERIDIENTIWNTLKYCLQNTAHQKRNLDPDLKFFERSSPSLGDCDACFNKLYQKGFGCGDLMLQCDKLKACSKHQQLISYTMKNRVYAMKALDGLKICYYDSVLTRRQKLYMLRYCTNYAEIKHCIDDLHDHYPQCSAMCTESATCLECLETQDLITIRLDIMSLKKKLWSEIKYCTDVSMKREASPEDADFTTDEEVKPVPVSRERRQPTGIVRYQSCMNRWTYEASKCRDTILDCFDIHRCSRWVMINFYRNQIKDKESVMLRLMNKCQASAKNKVSTFRSCDNYQAIVQCAAEIPQCKSECTDKKCQICKLGSEYTIAREKHRQVADKLWDDIEHCTGYGTKRRLKARETGSTVKRSVTSYRSCLQTAYNKADKCGKMYLRCDKIKNCDRYTGIKKDEDEALSHAKDVLKALDNCNKK